MKIRARHAVLGATGVVLLGAWLGAVAYHAYLVSTVAKYRAQLRATGERLEFKEVAPAAAPPERNRAAYIRQAAALFKTRGEFPNDSRPPAMKIVTPGKAMIGWAQPEVWADKTRSWAQIEETLQPCRPILRDLPTLIESPVLDFGLDYARLGPTSLLPDLLTLKQITLLLSAAALTELHQTNSAAANTDIRGILAVVRGTSDEPLMIFQLQRCVLTQIALADTWELLQTQALKEAQLASLQADWAALDFVQSAEGALVMERPSIEQTLTKMRGSSAKFREIASALGTASGGSGTWLENLSAATRLKARECLWDFSWSYTDELQLLKVQQVLLESIRLVRRQSAFQPAFEHAEAGLLELGLLPSPQDSESAFESGLQMRRFLSQYVGLRRLLDRVLAAEASRQLAVTAIALKRYHLAHENYPDELASLVPDFLLAIPRDPADGKPMRYRLLSSQEFLLYSIGEDCQDDGGDASPASQPQSESLMWVKGRDWVWPRAATSEEVKVYYQSSGRPADR